MFRRRLKVLLAMLGVALLAIIARLGQLQIVQADYYRREAERSVLTKPTSLPFVRGRILDRTGKLLVSDVPCWDLCVDFGIIAADVGDDPSAMKRHVASWRRAGRYPQAKTDEDFEAAFRGELSAMWREMAPFVSDVDPVGADLRNAAREIYDNVVRIRQAVAEWRGFDAPVAEETLAHAVVTGLDADQQIAAREVFTACPWVQVRPSSTRLFADDAAPLAHVLGRLGWVDAAHIAADPDADDPFARYLPSERVGISGIESAAEHLLRGRRGQTARDHDGNLIAQDCVEAENGQDATLTIHAGLQRRLYGLLREAVSSTPNSSGGAIVVLDVPTREVLALVSYPSYDPNRFGELYPTLRDQTDRLPLRFRAVANQYAPGSLVKPLVCMAALMNGRISLDTREECIGYLLPDHPDRWRCWQIHGTDQRKAHGNVNVVEALIGSCNVFMYHVGERLGVDGLCSAFDMGGIGRHTGTGLPEEVEGINPTPSWLMTHKGIRPTPGTARLFAIGQGEVAVTPLQAANLMATLASARYRPVTLVKNKTATPEWILPVTREHWDAIRRGIYGVVNDPEGTAYKYARFEHDRYALCGKTGSATAQAWPTSYRVPYLDARGVKAAATVPAGSKREAVERFSREHPSVTFDPDQVEVATRWPPAPHAAEDEYAHAWFGGFLQEIDGSGQPVWSRTPRIAFTVLIEFGGSGGRTSGPLAKKVAEELLNVLGLDLNADADPTADTGP